MKELRDVVCGFIQNFPLSIDNVAAIAQEFSHFENASQALFSNCVAFIKAQFTNVDSLLTFVQRHDDEITVMKLLKGVKVTKDCSNCRQKPCRDNSDILAADLLEPDMMVRTKKDNGTWGPTHQDRLCRVVSTSGGGKFCASWSIKPAPASAPDPFDTYRDGLTSGKPMFKYACNK